MDNQNKLVETTLNEWDEIKGRLDQLFRDRDQTAVREWMERGIDLFIQLLGCSNDLSVIERQHIPYQKLHYKPINMEERLGFIMLKPVQYHAYKQLSELMVEQEKIFVKKNIMKKTSGPRPRRF